ncbi:MAG: GHKL domain-containing protein [Huintestinicola sp.]
MDTDFAVWEAVLFSFLNSVPYMILVLISFRKRFRFSKRITMLLLAAAALSQVTLNTYRLFSPQVQNPVFDLIISSIYVGFIFLAINDRFGKLVFTVLVLMDLGNLVIVTSKCIEGIFFYNAALLRYHFTYSLVMLPVLAVILPAVYFLIFRCITNDNIFEQSSRLAWRYLWLIPAVFYLIWTQHFYSTGKSALENALDPLSTGYLLLIDLGSVLIYRTVVKLSSLYDRNARLQEDNHELQLQKMQYDIMEQRMEDMRKTRHDLRHHVVLLRQIRQTGELSQIDKLIESYPAPILNDQPFRFCQHDTVNAILVYYSDICLNCNINFSAEANISKDCFIGKPDLSVMLGNILENAVEACRLVQNAPSISVCGEYTRETDNPAHFSLIVKNSYNIEPHVNENGVFLSSKHTGNGIGIASVQSIVKRYGGNCTFIPDNGVFTVSVIIFE